MSATATGDRVLERGPLRVEIGLAPLSIHVRRAGRRLLRALTVWACEGEVRDRFVQVTEGVIADERLGFPERAVAATIAASDEAQHDDRADAQRRPPRRAAHRARGPRAPRARAVGRGRAAAAGHRVGRARRGALRRAGRAPRAARRPRRARGPARRRPRLHRPRLPARHARAGRHPAGRLRAGAVPAVQPRLRAVVRDVRQRHALRARRAHAGLDPRRGRAAAPARPHRPDARRPPAPLRAPHRPARAAAGRGATASGSRATSTPTRTTPRRTSTAAAGTASRSTRSCSTRRGRRNTTRGSPTRTSSRTSPGWSRRWRAIGVRTVVWVTPWVNLESLDGQIPPDPGSRRLHREPAPNYEPRALRPQRPRASRTSRAGGWARGRWSTSPTPRARRGGARRPCARCAWASRASRPTTARATTWARTCASPTGRRGAQTAWRYGGLYRRSMQRALDDAHGPGRGVLFGRSGWSGQQADGHAVGGRPGLGLLVAAHAGGVEHRGRRQRLLELVARRRRLPRPPAGRALPEGAAAALGPARRLHAAHAGPRPARAGAVDLRPRDARALPRLRAAARDAQPLPARRGGQRGARRAADPPPGLAAGLPAAGRWPTRSGSGPRCGSRRSSRRERASATPGCRRATGSRRGRARACAAGARCRRPRRCTRSRSGSAPARSSSPTPPSPCAPASARVDAPAARDAVGRAALRARPGPAGRRDGGALGRRALVGPGPRRRDLRRALSAFDIRATPGRPRFLPRDIQLSPQMPTIAGMRPLIGITTSELRPGTLAHAGPRGRRRRTTR